MINKILTASGGTDYGTVSLQYALEFAKLFNAELLGLYVEEPGAGAHPALSPSIECLECRPMRATERTERIWAHFETECRSACVKGAFIIREGLISRVICEEARNVDLVVMPRLGERKALLERVVGSTPERVIREVTKPVLIVPHKYRKTKHILIAYTGGAYAQKSLKFARKLYEKTSATITVLTVMESQMAASDVQEGARRYFAEKKVPANFLVRSGDADREIARAAKELKASLVILGACGRSRIKALFLSCVAFTLIPLSNRALLVVK